MLDAFSLAKQGKKELAITFCQDAKSITNDYNAASMDILQMLYLEYMIFNLIQEKTNALARINTFLEHLSANLGDYSTKELLYGRTIPHLLKGKLN